MTHHSLQATTETTHWGWFEAGLPPVLTIDSGDSVTIETLSGAPEHLPPEGFDIPEALRDIHARAPRRLGPHLLTGPIAVRGAMPGDMLEVRVLEVTPTLDWGYVMCRPLSGALQGAFEGAALVHPRIDRARGVVQLPWGPELPLRPFFGVMAVAPPPAWGAIPTIQPRRHGGNLDNKELVAGTTLFLPVLAEGALFSCGDGHGVQGDGEVCITALETALSGRFEFHLHRGQALDYPRAETRTHLISMGMHEDLDTAARDALGRMIDWVCELSALSRTEAYMLLSLAADLRITQLVNGEKGCHMVLEKSVVAQLHGARL